eukprot:316936_1
MGTTETKIDSTTEVKTSTNKITTSLAFKSTHNSSSFGGGVDPRDKFRQDIQRQSNLGKLPPICMQHRFAFYVWESGFGFGHDSIVIGSGEEDNLQIYGYFTIELRVDEEKEVVIPYTEYISFDDGNKAKTKWKLQFKLDTTIDELINFAIELIDKHGTYSSFHNGCQHFVRDFLNKINGTEFQERLQAALQENESYQSALKSKIPCSSSVRWYRGTKISNAIAKEVGGKADGKIYNTVEDTALGATGLLIVPAAAILASKAAIDDNERDQVKWNGNCDDKQQELIIK